MTVPIGVQLEINQALRDIYEVMQEYGDDVDFYLREETEVVRDKYNSVKTPNGTKDFTLKCFPIEFSPSQFQMKKAGISERVDLIIYTSMYDWNLQGKTISDIDPSRTSIVYGDETWVVKDKNQTGNIGNTQLYITLGLVKK